MSDIELPDERVMNRAFIERGRADVVKIDVFPVSDGEWLKLTFEAKASPWRQGVWLKSDDRIVVGPEESRSIQLWQDTAPAQVLMRCHTRSGRLHLYNIWDKGSGRESQSWTSGMLVEEIPSGRRYRCNDIGFDSGFSKSVFRLERVKRPE